MLVELWDREARLAGLTRFSCGVEAVKKSTSYHDELPELAG
jgi:hypothetical protein